MKFVRALISAPSKKEAQKIAAALLKERLVAGALVTSGNAVYWWKGRITEKTYWNISTFSRKSKTQRIVPKVKAIHSDSVPIISFFEICSANKDFLKWIKLNTDES